MVFIKFKENSDVVLDLSFPENCSSWFGIQLKFLEEGRVVKPALPLPLFKKNCNRTPDASTYGVKTVALIHVSQISFDNVVCVVFTIKF